MKSRSEKSQKFNLIRGKIVDTIKMYEDMLENCEDSGERSIIASTLKTLYS